VRHRPCSVLTWNLSTSSAHSLTAPTDQRTSRRNGGCPPGCRCLNGRSTRPETSSPTTPWQEYQYTLATVTSHGCILCGTGRCFSLFILSLGPHLLSQLPYMLVIVIQIFIPLPVSQSNIMKIIFLFYYPCKEITEIQLRAYRTLSWGFVSHTSRTCVAPGSCTLDKRALSKRFAHILLPRASIFPLTRR
jgi:hypothetical protein